MDSGVSAVATYRIRRSGGQRPIAVPFQRRLGPLGRRPRRADAALTTVNGGVKTYHCGGSSSRSGRRPQKQPLEHVQEIDALSRIAVLRLSDRLGFCSQSQRTAGLSLSRPRAADCYYSRFLNPVLNVRRRTSVSFAERTEDIKEMSLPLFRAASIRRVVGRFLSEAAYRPAEQPNRD